MWSEQGELIRIFPGLTHATSEADDVFVLLVSDHQDVDSTTIGQRVLDAFAVRLGLLLAGAKAHAHGELRHLKPLIKQEISEIRGGLALFLSSNWQVEQGHDPHEAVG